ncbi:MAG: DUF2806 domain-containing protein [Nitrospinae bacterium]|nr:DUF2806 domain-containing protein [Nitrospinota bacterium]
MSEQIHLANIGLLTENFLGYTEKFSGESKEISYQGKKYNMLSKQVPLKLEFTTVGIASVGRELARLVPPNPHQEYFEDVVQYFKSMGVELKEQ